MAAVAVPTRSGRVLEGGYLLLKRLGNMPPGTVIPAAAFEAFGYRDRLGDGQVRYFDTYAEARAAGATLFTQARAT